MRAICQLKSGEQNFSKIFPGAYCTAAGENKWPASAVPRWPHFVLQVNGCSIAFGEDPAERSIFEGRQNEGKAYARADLIIATRYEMAKESTAGSYDYYYVHKFAHKRERLLCEEFFHQNMCLCWLKQSFAKEEQQPGILENNEHWRAGWSPVQDCSLNETRPRREGRKKAQFPLAGTEPDARRCKAAKTICCRTRRNTTS